MYKALTMRIASVNILVWCFTVSAMITDDCKWLGILTIIAMVLIGAMLWITSFEKE